MTDLEIESLLQKSIMASFIPSDDYDKSPHVFSLVINSSDYREVYEAYKYFQSSMNGKNLVLAIRRNVHNYDFSFVVKSERKVFNIYNIPMKENLDVFRQALISGKMSAFVLSEFSKSTQVIRMEMGSPFVLISEAIV